MEDAPLTVSAIVPVLDAAAHVSVALESILAQTHPVDEIVAIDGGSTDGTLDVVGSFPGVRIVSQADDGLPAARNLGLDLTSGAVVAFLDADDRWEPTKTAVQLAALASAPGTDVVAGHMQRFRLGDEPVHLGAPAAALTPSGVLVRRSVFGVVGGFDEQFRIAADTDWFMRVRDARLICSVLPDLVLRKGMRPERLSADVVRYRAELLRALHGSQRRRGRTRR